MHVKLQPENLNGKRTTGCLNTDCKILKFALNECCVTVYGLFRWLVLGFSSGFCDHGNDPSRRVISFTS